MEPKRERTIKETDEFNLSFPMRNSRLSQAVMTSLTIDANSNHLL